MRDKTRIIEFCIALAELWEKNVPDWRFGQLVCNLTRYLENQGNDIFFYEENEMYEVIKKYLEG